MSETRDTHFGGMKPPSPWQPMSDAIELAKIGKLGEEAAELAKACSRAIIQGLSGVDPESGVTNREAIRKEIADVQAGSHICADLVGNPDSDRVLMKERHLRGWHELIAPSNVVNTPAPAGTEEDDAAQSYIRECWGDYYSGNEQRLPGGFYWHECFERMQRAAIAAMKKG